MARVYTPSVSGFFPGKVGVYCGAEGIRVRKLSNARTVQWIRRSLVYFVRHRVVYLPGTEYLYMIMKLATLCYNEFFFLLQKCCSIKYKILFFFQLLLVQLFTIVLNFF